MPRKRTHEEMEDPEPPQEKQQTSILSKIRSMWEFAAVMQYIFMFGKAVKIDEDFDIEVPYPMHHPPDAVLLACGGVVLMIEMANLMV